MIQGCFTPLQTYKVLKHSLYTKFLSRVLHHYKLTRFSNEVGETDDYVPVLHHYKLTRFSNNLHNHIHIYKFYTITNLQGSQTSFKLCHSPGLFYTITNLQGSQTASLLFSLPVSFTPLQTYKVLKRIL